MTPAELDARVEDAFVYAYPLHAVARTRGQALAQAPGANTLRHIRTLSDHRARWITAPNNDTLYSNAWLDLSGGLVRLRVEAQPAGRYWSVALMDAWTNHVAIVGQRLDGSGPVEVTLAGPAHHHDDIPGRVIRMPGQDAWLFARSLVDGPDDLPAAHAMQDRLHLQGPDALPPAGHPEPGAADEAANFLAVVNHALGRNPAPAADAQVLARCADVGLRPGETDAWSRLSADVQAAWQRTLGPALARLRQAGRVGRRDIQGWITALPEIGDFGTHYTLRASVALGGLGALTPAEATYFVRYHDAQGELLHGRHRHCVRIPASGIPTDSFWSFTMYEVLPDGKRVLVDNPIARYSIGNRTPGLVTEPDGSLVLALQHAMPQDARERANWLPAPEGTFQVSLRCYAPQAVLRDGLAVMPGMER